MNAHLSIHLFLVPFMNAHLLICSFEHLRIHAQKGLNLLANYLFMNAHLLICSFAHLSIRLPLIPIMNAHLLI